MVSMPPITLWSNPKAPSQAAQIVLLCTELKAKPKVIEINTAKNTHGNGQLGKGKKYYGTYHYRHICTLYGCGRK